MTNAIATEGLTTRYGRHRGIENVTFSVAEGSICGFIGPNGAGKSTTIRTLLGLLRPKSGRAEILGLDCVKDATDIARVVGYLPGEARYYERLSGRALLRYAEGLYGVPCRARAKALADELELDLRRRIGQLSLGNRKKLGLVQALMHDPQVLILDEPTSGLDPLVQQTFFNLLRREQARGLTVLFSSHVLADVQRLCDNVVIIREGTVIAQERIEALTAQAFKKVHLVSRMPLPADVFGGLNVAGLEQNDAEASFLFRGEMAALLAVLQRLPLLDLTVSEPALEEVFLHYYEGRTDDGGL